MKLTKPQRVTIAAKSSNRCFYCGCCLDKNKYEIDHFLPFSIYKNSKTQNLVAACVRCNRVKSDLSIEDFRWRIYSLTGLLPEFFFEKHGIVLIGSNSIFTKGLSEQIY